MTLAACYYHRLEFCAPFGSRTPSDQVHDHRSKPKRKRITLDRTKYWASKGRASWSGSARCGVSVASGSNEATYTVGIQCRDDPFLSWRGSALEYMAQPSRHNDELGGNHCRRNSFFCIQFTEQSTLCYSDQLDPGCNLPVDGGAPISLLRDLVKSSKSP